MDLVGSLKKKDTKTARMVRSSRQAGMFNDGSEWSSCIEREREIEQEVLREE